jgi:hypothetical protein
VADHLQRDLALVYVQAHRSALAWHGYAGVWVDGDDLVFDVVELVHERSIAIHRGRERGELAVYDVANGEDIETGIERGSVAWREHARTDC